MRFAFLAAVALAGFIHLARAQDEFDRPFDGLQAGQDAYERGEAVRQQRIADQAYLNDAIQDWRAGSVVFYRPYGAVGGYGYAGNGLRGDVDYGATWGGGVGGYGAYGYQGGYGLGGFRSPYYVTPLDPGAAGYYQRSTTSGVYRPGAAIVVPAYPTPLRQPIGQWTGQTGPNRWESHPVYGDDVVVGEEPNDEPPPPPKARGPIVKPKIYGPPPKREY